jgi:phosphatidate cytidylyltransferase
VTSAKAARKSDLPVRAAAGVAMIAIAVAAIYFGGWPFRILVGVAAALMLVEWADMHKVRRNWALAGVALLAFNLWLLPDLLPGQIWYGFAAAIALGLLVGLLSRSARLGGGYLYVAIPSFALLVLNGLSWEAVLWAMVVTWSTDIFAYFAGRSIGGPKLAPNISPNKTWAGLIGGMAGAAVLGFVTARMFDLDAPFLYVGALMGLLAQIGDLYESSVKRRAGVKDSGTILPGHGGVLDRLDGLLPVVVATLILILASSAA